MGININKYNKRSDYLTDNNKPVGESRVSQVDTNVVFDTVNAMLEGDQLCDEDVYVVLKDKLDGRKYYIPIDTYLPEKIDTDRYAVQNHIVYGVQGELKLKMHKSNAGDRMYAEFNRYKIELDTAEAGGFTWAVTVNGTAKGGTVEWEAGATIDSVVEQLQTGAMATYLVFSHVEGEDFIRVRKGGHSNSTFTVTNATGATLVDLSLYTKVAGVQQEETHRDWQSVAVATLFPGYGIMAPTTAQYAKNGLNLSYRCIGNMKQAKAYFRTNGKATWIPEGDVSSRLKESAFQQCADGTIGGADGIALYNKYNGSWDAYMEASKIQLNDIHRDGVEFKSFTNGPKTCEFLASVTTMDFDGSYIPAFPGAYLASQVEVDGEAGCLGSNHEIGTYMDDVKFEKINKAITAIGGTKLYITAYYMGFAEYNASNYWLYYGSSGCFNDYSKHSSLTVRPVRASA